MDKMVSTSLGSDMDRPAKVGEIVEEDGRKWRVLEAMPPRRLSEAERRMLKTDAAWAQVRALELIEVTH